MYIGFVMHLADYMAGKNPEGRKFSDDEIATRIRRTRATVSRIRRGKVRPDWGTIKVLEEVTGGLVTASDFIELPSDPAPASDAASLGTEPHGTHEVESGEAA